MNTDFKELLRAFNDHEVRYLIVGGYAVMKYSEPSFTTDLDDWVEESTKHSQRVFKALTEFGAPLSGLTEADFASNGFYQMGRPPARVDVLMELTGLDFQAAWRRRVAGSYDGVETHFLSLEDLIENKSA